MTPKTTTFAGGLLRPEGPVILPDGSLAVIEGGRGSVTRISPDGCHAEVVAITGEPNGLAIDRHGDFWVADIRPCALIRLHPEGRFERVLSGWEGKPFIYPNDLCFGPDGSLYLTDSGIHDDTLAPGGVLRSDWRDLPVDGRVFRIDPRTLEVVLVDDGLRFPNGITFGPDRSLFVNETMTGMVYRYEWTAGRLGPRQDFGNVWDRSKLDGFRGPDGMAFDAVGNLYVAVYAQGDVTVLGPSGEVRERIVTPGNQPTNVCFDLPGRRRLFVTEYERGEVLSVEVASDGLPLFI